MIERPEYFNIEIEQHGYVLYANEQDRVYVPQTKEEFYKFLGAVYSMVDNPTEEQKQNYEIIKEYPFLLPKNRWDRGFSFKDSEMMFTYTELNWMPKVWLDDFGWQMVQEIKDAIVAEDENFLYQYTIIDIKHKWNGLRWYDMGHTSAIAEVIDKYEQRSYEVELQ